MRRAWLRHLVLGGCAACAVPGCDREIPAGEAVRVLSAFGAMGDTPGRFAYPRAICADDRTGTLWVIDKTGRVQQMDAAGGEVLSVWRMPETESGKPTGVTLGPGIDRDNDHLLFIPDTHYHRVMIYRPPAPPAPGAGKRIEERPELVASFGTYGDGPGNMIFPTDIGVLPTPDGSRVERLYVSEYGGNDRVAAYDASFKFLFSFGSFGVDSSSENIQFNRPQSIAVDLSRAAQQDTGGRGRLIVTDSRNDRVGVFTLEGKLLRWLGSGEPTPVAAAAPGVSGSGRDVAETGAATFRIPYGIEVLGDGTALISEFEGCRVHRVNLATGRTEGTWGHPGRGEGELLAPWGVATMGERTFILDSGNNRVLGFQTPRRRAG